MQASPGFEHVPTDMPPHACTNDDGWGWLSFCMRCAAHASVLTRVTVTDWTPGAVAACVVHVPSQGLGRSRAVPGPGQVEVKVLAVAANPHEPLDGSHTHPPHDGAAGGGVAV